jgi:GNAT superfamily N-acetyltransferase
MKITLKEAHVSDCEKIHEMQIIGFKALLDKYQDYETNPGAESLEKIKWRFEFPQGQHYFIEANGESVGYIRIVRIDEQTCNLSQMFILPKYQGNGFAQQAIQEVEMLKPQAKHWTLDTIEQEEKLCYLYEKMGYKRTGTKTIIKDGMNIVDYAKSYLKR